MKNKCLNEGKEINQLPISLEENVITRFSTENIRLLWVVLHTKQDQRGILWCQEQIWINHYWLVPWQVWLSAWDVVPLCWFWLLPVGQRSSLPHPQVLWMIPWCLTFFLIFLAMPHSLWDLSFTTRDWTWALALKVQSPNHWTSREFLTISLMMNLVQKLRIYWDSGNRRLFLKKW